MTDRRIAQQSSGLRLAAQLSAQQAQFTKAYADIAKTMRSPGYLAMIKSMQTQQADLAKSLAIYQQSVRSFAVSEMFESLRVQQAAFADSLSRLSRSTARMPVVAELLGSNSSAWLKAVRVNLSSLSELASKATLPVASTELMRQLVAFSEFASSTTSRLTELTERSSAFAPLVHSLDLAQREVEDSSLVTPAVIGLADAESAGGEPRRIRRLNLLVVEREELIASAGSGGVLRVDDYRFVCPATDTAGTCRSIQKLIVDCNETAELTTNRKVFKYTDRVVGSLVDLAWIVPRTKLQLSEFVTVLYFALYEGAGADSLRYMDEGLLSDTDCEFIWHLKHLRNKWLLHDIEHGSQGDVRRSKNDLKEALEYFGFSHLPVRASEFRQLHRAIAERAEAFLTTLLKRLQAR